MNENELKLRTKKSNDLSESLFLKFESLKQGCSCDKIHFVLLLDEGNYITGLKTKTCLYSFRI